MSVDAERVPAIAFLGGGIMAAALIGGLLKTGWPAERLMVAEPIGGRAAWLEQQFAIKVAGDITTIAGEADALVLAVKPQQLTTALTGVVLKPGAMVISIVAGVRLATLRRLLGHEVAYVRTMPNTPALLGAGITGLFASPDTPGSARTLAERLLAAAGTCVWVDDETQLDAVTALSGSGPAYVFLLVEAMRNAGKALGLDAKVSAELAAQTCIGAARMVGESGLDVAELRRHVTSKGGTTEAAVAHLEAAGFHAIFADAMQAAATRATELGDALDHA